MRLFVDARFVMAKAPKPSGLHRFLKTYLGIAVPVAPQPVFVQWAIGTADGRSISGTMSLDASNWAKAAPLAHIKPAPPVGIAESETDTYIAGFFMKVLPAKTPTQVILLANLDAPDTAKALHWSIVDSIAFALRSVVHVADLYSWDMLLADHGVSGFATLRPAYRQSPGATVHELQRAYSLIRHRVKQAVSWVHEETEQDNPIKIDEFKALRQLEAQVENEVLSPNSEQLVVKVSRSHDSTLDPGFNVFDEAVIEKEIVSMRPCLMPNGNSLIASSGDEAAHPVVAAGSDLDIDLAVAPEPTLPVLRKTYRQLQAERTKKKCQTPNSETPCPKTAKCSPSTSSSDDKPKSRRRKPKGKSE